jgi:hypothetical protein
MQHRIKNFSKYCFLLATLAFVGTAQALTYGPVPAPTVTLTASATALPVGGGNITFTWSSTNAYTCDGVGGSRLATSGSKTINITKTGTYTMSCRGAGVTASSNVSVGVGSEYYLGVNTSINLGGTLHVYWTTPTATNDKYDSVALFIPGGLSEISGYSTYTNGAQSGEWDVIPPTAGTYEIHYCVTSACVNPVISSPITVIPPPYILNVSPTTLKLGEAVHVAWTLLAPNVDDEIDIHLHEVGGSQSTLYLVTYAPATGAIDIVPPAAGMYEVEFCLMSFDGTNFYNNCDYKHGSSITPISVSMGALAPTVTLTKGPLSFQSGGGEVTLTWSSTNSTSCTATSANGVGGAQWSNGKATSGTQTLTDLRASGSYTLTCSGAGGNTSASVNVYFY